MRVQCEAPGEVPAAGPGKAETHGACAGDTQAHLLAEQQEQDSGDSPPLSTLPRSGLHGGKHISWRRGATETKPQKQLHWARREGTECSNRQRPFQKDFSGVNF